MELEEIYRPVQKELEEVDRLIAASLHEAKNKSILKVNHFLLGATGKRIRPALVILCAKAALGHRRLNLDEQLIKVATGIELVHMASLIHDDVIDHSLKRHNKETINKRFGEDVSIALGDYLYAKAFELISSCHNTDIFSCISQATRLMCEGELIQVCERDNLSLLKERYILIVKKKTAALFMASCQAGATLSSSSSCLKDAFKEYGLNFGIAFQIVDDCMDLIGEEKSLGKAPGADFRMGELTLPVLNLISQNKNRKKILCLVKQQNESCAFKRLREAFINSKAFSETKEDADSYIEKAKHGLGMLGQSYFKESLLSLADFITERIESPAGIRLKYEG